MKVNTGLYEVLNSAETSSVHSQGEGVATTHKKEAWIKNLTNNIVTKVNLYNSSVPLVPGHKVGLSFVNDNEIIAFKRTQEIPVEPAVPSTGPRSSIGVLFYALMWAGVFSIPILGYLAAIAVGLVTSVSNQNILGRFKTAPTSNRILGLIAVVYGIAACFKGGNSASGMVVYHIFLTVVIFAVFLSAQSKVFKRERELLARASHELDACWMTSR